MSMPKWKHLKLKAGLLCAILLLTMTSTYGARYVITQIISPPPTQSSARAINDSGVVTGLVTSQNGTSNAYTYANYSTTTLGSLGGEPAYSNMVSAINGAGQVAGTSPSSGTPAYTHAVVWTNAVPQDLGVLPGTIASSANGINDLGVVVGTSGSYPFVWQNGVMSAIGSGTGAAYSINSSGMVAGISGSVPVVWDSLGNMTTLTTANGSARHINEQGQVVGYAYTGSSYSGFVWQNGNFQFLSTPSGATSVYANSINSGGKTVGQGYFASLSKYHALLWENATVSDLNDLIPAGSGWVLTNANDINTAGQIVGDGTFNGKTQAYLLTPSQTPETLATVAGTAGAAGWYVSPTTVTLSATDYSGSGIKEIHYSLDSAPEIVAAGASATVAIGTEGTHTLQYYAVDNAGHGEQANVKQVNIDLTSPAVTVSTSPAVLIATTKSKLVPVTINGSGTDTVSGVASVVITISDEYGVYNSTLNSFGTTVQLDTYKKRADSDGRLYTITATVTDVAGQQGTAIYSLWAR